MKNSFLIEIRDHARSSSRGIPFAPATRAAVDDAEKSLGFRSPELLKALYLDVGNGGFGPGYGIIGVEGGHASNLGTLVKTVDEIKRGADYLGVPWEAGLLPFCEWGCNIFSCVDCNRISPSVFISEEGVVRPQNYDLEAFFHMWIAGVTILDRDWPDTESIEIINPFTRDKTRVTRRGRKK